MLLALTLTLIVLSPPLLFKFPRSVKADMSVGSLLKQARREAGLSIEQLSATSRIRCTLIRDLEKDCFTSCGGEAYVRGHIRSLAKICDADAVTLLEAYDKIAITEDRTMRDLLNESSATKSLKVRSPISWKAISTVAAGVVTLGFLGSFVMNSVRETNQSVNVAANTSATTATATPTQTQTQTQDRDNLGAVATKTNDVTIILTATNGLSWVSVTDSVGGQLFSDRLRQGESRTFTDNQLLYLVIGNSGAINVNVNGEDLGFLGSVGSVTRSEYGPQANKSAG